MIIGGLVMRVVTRVVKDWVKGFCSDVEVRRMRGSICGSFPHDAPAIPHAEDL